MAVTYSYKINHLLSAPSLDGLSDVVTRAHFEYKGIDENGASGSFMGVCPFPAPNSSNFTPLSSLTEEQVIGWIQEVHPVDHMKEKIQIQIDQQNSPTRVEIPLPWAPVTE